MKIPKKIPDWLGALPGHALLTTLDLYKMFGYKSRHTMVSSIKSYGHPFPDPDFKGNSYASKTNKYPIYIQNRLLSPVILRWKASTIRSFIRQKNRELNNVHIDTEKDSKGA